MTTTKPNTWMTMRRTMNTLGAYCDVRCDLQRLKIAYKEDADERALHMPKWAWMMLNWEWSDQRIRATRKSRRKLNALNADYDAEAA